MGGHCISPWVDSRSGRVVLPPPSLLPWFLETRCLLLGHKPSESLPLVPSSRAFLPSCCACFALEWSGHRSQNRLQKKEKSKSGVWNILLNIFILYLHIFIFKLGSMGQNHAYLNDWISFPLLTVFFTLIHSYCTKAILNFMFLQKINEKNYLLSLTDPSIPRRMLSLFISLWITWLECRKSRAWRHWIERKSLKIYLADTHSLYLRQKLYNLFLLSLDQMHLHVPTQM